MDNSGYVIQESFDKQIGRELWKTISPCRDLEATQKHFDRLERRNPNSGRFRIFYDAPDLMRIGAICEG